MAIKARPLGAHVSGITAAWIVNNLGEKVSDAALVIAQKRGREAAEELLQTFQDLQRAVKEWERFQGLPAISPSGNAETQDAEIERDSLVTARKGWITTRQAADALGLTPRRVRQLLDGEDGPLAGKSVAGRWLVSTESVATYKTLRRTA